MNYNDVIAGTGELRDQLHEAEERGDWEREEAIREELGYRERQDRERERDPFGRDEDR